MTKESLYQILSQGSSQEFFVVKDEKTSDYCYLNKGTEEIKTYNWGYLKKVWKKVFGYTPKARIIFY